MSEDLKQSLNDKVSKISSAFDASEMTSYAIWGAAVTTTRAFESVKMQVDPMTQRIFVGITLRWWAKAKRLKLLHDSWLKRAEARCCDQLPEGWKLLIYYVK